MAQKFVLTGIVDDGSELDPLMPRDTATTISVPKAADVQIDVAPFYPSGEYVDFATIDANWSAKMVIANVIRGTPQEPITIDAISATGDNGAVLRFLIKPLDTQFLPLQRYLFDVWLLMSSKRYQIIRLSSMRLAPGMLAV